ncbi:class I SAM-dependent methyltransferase [Geomonas sp. RF6]|uniref:tRNA (mnm(5)s(2)U34)-methyltransferase n=1 Tax=Geomonas sp. RF6 TaxID=2897342 RepID=UPI001E374C0A|nr:class I SAM-dependent methyltransferase [Geomonas sp. RF6]UFS71355.1 class I SAM-dependent methyltransferase [Geomonas sp. RF6]
MPLAHFFLRERLRSGDVAVDATCGNGQDTLLLARLVGARGRVWGFDVQASAIAATHALLEVHGVSSCVELIHGGHERLAQFVPPGVRAVVFNLGYLPGSETPLTTTPENTIAALGQAAELLARGGFILICVYTGHEGGPEEAEAVEEWCRALSPKLFNAWSSRQLNRPAVAPYLVVVEKV